MKKKYFVIKDVVNDTYWNSKHKQWLSNAISASWFDYELVAEAVVNNEKSFENIIIEIKKIFV